MKLSGRMTLPIAVLIAAAGNPVSAQEVDVQSLISPNERSIEAGALGALDSNRTTGKYTGLSDNALLPIVNGTLIQRDEATGTWVRARGIDLGLSSRELGLEYEQQGDSKYFFNFSQVHKSNPLEIFTGLTGTDSNRQTINGMAKRPLDLETDRYNGQLGLRKFLSKEFDVQASYRSEYKEGGRPWGNGTMNFLVDPIDQVTHEFDAKVNYTTERLQLTGGFLGSVFENEHKALYVNHSTTTLALPPDNEAYNVYLSGGYNFTPQTRGNFKLSQTMMLQNDDFFTRAGGLDGNFTTDLDGEIQNTLASAGVTSRVTDDLTLLGKARWESRNDKTPVLRYISPPSASRTGFNILQDRDTLTTEGEATYRLPDNYSLTGGVKYEYWERSAPAARQASWRTTTDEYSGRAQVGKTMTESLGGTAAYIYSTRTGSAFLPDASGISVIDPIHWGDRERHQARLNLNWAPTPVWSVQAVVDGSMDTYHAATRPLGPEEGMSNNASLDATYQLTKEWDITGFVSRNEITREQKTIDSEGTGGVQGLWSADLKNRGYAGGVILGGKPTERLKVKAEAQYSYDKSEYELRSSTAAIQSLPDIAYRQFDLKLSSDYAVSANGTVRVGYVFTHLGNSDFTYDQTIYTEGTVINLPDWENSHFIGVSYIHKW